MNDRLNSSYFTSKSSYFSVNVVTLRHSSFAFGTELSDTIRMVHDFNI